MVAGFRRLPLWKKIFVVAWPTLVLLIFIAIITTISFAGALGSKDALMNRNNTGVTLLDRNGKAFYSFNDAHNDTYVQLKDIAPIAQKAVVSSEDKNFYAHPGFSIVGIGNAIYQNLLRAGGGGGGSTLTQQMVKNALLSQERSIFRKYQELVLSIEVERRYSKDEILEMYLNSAYFGEGAFGIEDASKAYFGKSAKDLDNAEATLLIGLLPAPSAYSPITGDPVKAKQRQKYVLNRMKEDGVLNEEQVTAAYDKQLAYADQKANEVPDAPHFALMVKDWLEEKYGEEKIARSGYKVTTTLDIDAQGKAQAAVKQQVDRLKNSKVTNGSAVVLDPRNGEILALVGSADWNNETNGKVNMTTATRQPGSSFKPLVYATGIEDRKLTAATIFDDKKTDFGGGYTPNNYDGRFRGNVTLRRALSNSLNVPAVEAMRQVGISNVISNAKEAGLTTLNQTAAEYGLPLALGSGQARLTEMTSAYATFGNEGKKNDRQMVLNIVNKNKEKIYESKPVTAQVWSPGTSYIISSILSDNSARSEVFGNSLTVAANRPVAVKTGTTEDYRDAWTIGYTPSLAIGVWIGNNDNSPMSSVAGSSGSGPIWLSLMRQILGNKAVEKFNQPSTVVARDVCKGDGALAPSKGDNTYTEFFLTGTLPTKTCNEPKQEEKPETTQPAPTEEKDTTAPAAPTGLMATPTTNSVSLKWTASTDDTAVTGYRIYRNGQLLASVAASTTYSDTTIEPLTQYSYTVMALDAAGNVSAQSTAATITTLAGSGPPSGTNP
jgi:1A family penicillin-binding protein